MPIHLLKLLERSEIARNTFQFIFEKPAGFSFKPGQYGGFTLINPRENDALGITRRLSLLSAPHDDYLAIALRMQDSAYKRMLKELPIGSEIKFAGPTGTFTLHEDKTIPAVFIAGGIGITPFYSMLRHAVQLRSSQPLYLFYGNQQLADAAFMTELEEFSRLHPAFTFIPVLEKPDATWHGETGFITHQLIRKYISDLFVPIYYICGSPAMVTTLQETLAEMAIDEDRIRVEDFAGY